MILDSHTHVLPDEFRSERERMRRLDATFRELFPDSRGISVGVEELVAEMDVARVDASVALGYGWTDPGVARLYNDYVLDAARRFPDRVIPFCSLNPLWGKDGAREVARCADAGARGIGELHPDYQGFTAADHNAMAPVMEAARERNMPIVVHGSEPVGHIYHGKGAFTPEKALALAVAFPGNTFIFAHFGGGLPFYTLMPEVGEALVNVYYDSAAFPYLYLPEVFPASVAAAGADRVLFASDFPLLSQTRCLVALGHAGLPVETLAKVHGANLSKLLGLR